MSWLNIKKIIIYEDINPWFGLREKETLEEIYLVLSTDKSHRLKNEYDLLLPLSYIQVVDSAVWNGKLFG